MQLLQLQLTGCSTDLQAKMTDRFARVQQVLLLILLHLVQANAEQSIVLPAVTAVTVTGIQCYCCSAAGTGVGASTDLRPVAPFSYVSPYGLSVTLEQF